MPIIPEKTGDKPPPLFNGLSSKSLSNLGFQSYSHHLRINAMRYSVIDQDDVGKSCMSTKLIKIVVSGNAGENCWVQRF